jgi:hypothetical protein
VNKAKVNALISSGTAVKGAYLFYGDAITMQFTGQERGDH